MAEPTSIQSFTPKLNRVRGQVDGIITMCEQNRSPVEIAQQLIAARNALSGVARDLLSQEAVRCADQQCYDELEAIVKELLR